MSIQNLPSIVDQCCVELFAAYDLAIERAREPDGASPEICAVLGFTGDLRGAAILATPTRCLETTSQGGDSRAWIGELANQLVGRVKNALLRHGVEIVLSTPVILRGERLAPINTMSELPSMFDSTAGQICLWFDFEATPDLQWSDAELDGVASSEGDAMFF